MTKDLLTSISEISEMMQQEATQYKQSNDTWWNNLSYEDKCNAFYAVVSRIHQGELKDHGTYRYILYDIFGFGPDMYTRGMDCGFMALHNSIVESNEEINTWKPMKQEVE